MFFTTISINISENQLIGFKLWPIASIAIVPIGTVIKIAKIANVKIILPAGIPAARGKVAIAA